MAIPTAASAAAKWSQNLGAAGPRIQEGVQAVTVSPGAKAAQQAQVWVANTQAALQKFQRNSAAVQLGDWQQATISKGVPRVAQGASAAQPKFEQFMTKLLPYVASQVASLPPRGGLAQNITRMTAFVQGMAKFQK